MGAIVLVACSCEHITVLDARQVASIVWSCTQLTVAHLPLMPLLDALDSPLLDDLPAQQVGWLADSMPLLPCRGRLPERAAQRLGASVNILAESLSSMAAAPDGFSETTGSLRSFAEAASRVGADQLGDSGSRLLLRTCGIGEMSPAAAMVLSPELSVVQKDSKRLLVRASSIFHIKIGESELKGTSVAVSGAKDGLRGNRWISPVQLPVAKLVDRSLCGEFQLLARLCDEILRGDYVSLPSDVAGSVHLFVTATPCLSCIAVLCQFHRLFPEIQLEVSWDSSVNDLAEKGVSHSHALQTC